MRKGVLELCILSMLRQRDMYVSDLLDEMKNARLLVVEGTLYPLLTRLKNENFLTYRWEESKMGPPRKYYKITEELNKGWRELILSVNKIINQNI